jgi:hypothetical protein
MLLLLQIATAAPVRVTAKPDRIYIERSPTAAHLEFDFLLEGTTDDTVRLTAIRLTARDRLGKPWAIRFVDESGSDPGIQTIPRREVAGRASVVVYNPFHDLPPEAPIARLDYELTFAKGEVQWKVPIEVRPIEWRQAVDLILPLKGRILVFDGHDFYAHHRRIDYEHPILKKAGVRGNSGRYAHDLSLVDDDDKMYRTDGKRNEDWYSWGAPVRAPGAGRVVAAENGMPDYDVGNPAAGLSIDTILARPASLMGNYVMIDHGGGVFSRIFHFMRGSVTVKPGQMVRQGQVLGKVGFSGSVYTIHSHYELGTGIGMDAEGLPLYVSRFRRIWGSRSSVVARGPIDSGDLVEQP